MGIRYVPSGYESGENVYTSTKRTLLSDSEEETRMALAYEKSREILGMEPGDLNLTTNPGRVSMGASGFFETESAMAGLTDGTKFYTYDTENLGTAKRSRSKKPGTDADFFELTEISLQESVFKDGQFVPQGKAVALVNELSPEGAEKLATHISRLEADPAYLLGLDKHTRRSLADLTLYDNSASFGMDMFNGQKVHTLRAQAKNKPSAKGSALGTSEMTKRMREGLSNLTDTRKVNTRGGVIGVLETLVANNPVLGGHNVNVFDKGNMLEWLNDGAVKASAGLNTLFGKNQIDTLSLGRQVLNRASQYVENYQLGSIYSFFNGEKKKGQAHFSAADVEMNTNVLNHLFPAYQQSVKAGKPGAPLANDQLFVAVNGSRYYESMFNRNAGQYDITLVKDKKTGEYVRRRSFQEATATKGHLYKKIGDYEKIDMNGIEHYAMQFEDVHTQTRKIVFRETKDELASFMDNTMQAVTATTSAEKMAFSKKDAARREYEDIFDPKIKYGSDTIPYKWERAKTILDTYQTQRNGLTNKGLSPQQLQHEAILLTEQTINANRGDAQYYVGYERIEAISNMEKTLNDERAFWDQVVESSVTPAGSANIKSQQAMQNLYIHNVYDQVIGKTEEKTNYGYNDMRRLPVISPKGETSYYNVESPQDVRSKVRQTLYKNGYSSSHVLMDFDRLLGDMGGNLSVHEKHALAKRVRQEMTGRSGQVSQGLMDEIANKLFQANENNQNIVSSIPGLAITSAVSDGTSQRALYMNNLVANKSAFFEDVVKSAKAETSQKFNGKMLSGGLEDFDVFRMSESAGKRVKLSEDVAGFLDTQSGLKKQFFNLKNKKQKFGHLEQNKAIKETLKAFEAQGFATELNFFEEKGDLVLFFADAKSAPLFGNMTTMEKMTSQNVRKMTIPLFDGDGTVNINGTKIVNRYKASFDGYTPGSSPNMYLSSTQDRAFENMMNVPNAIREKEKIAALIGKKTAFNELADAAISSYNYKMINGQIAKGYPGDIPTEKPYGTGSILKNFTSGMQVDMSDFGDIVLQRNFPQVFQEYESWKAQTNYHGNFLSSDFSGDRNIGRVKNAVTYRMDVEFNDMMKNVNGVSFTYQGMKPKQVVSGVGTFGESRGFTPFGIWNPTERENITKVNNYHALEEARMRKGLKGLGFSKKEIDARLTPNINKSGWDALSFTGAKEISSVGTNASVMDDFTLKARLEGAKTKIVTDIEKAEAELAQMQAKGLGLKAQTKLKNQIDELKAVKAELHSGLLTNYEGQSIVDRKLLESYEVVDDMNVKLKTGQDFTKEMHQRLAKETGIKVKDGASGLEYLPEGEVLFKKPMGYKEAEKLKLIDKNGKLTVGQLIEQEIKDGSDEATESVMGSQKYAFNKNSEILGIQNNNGQQSLIIRNRRVGHNGTKLIETNMGMRTTAIGASSKALEYLTGKKGIHAIIEEMSPDRKQYGGLTAISVQTNVHNIVDSLEKAAISGKTTGLAPAIAAYVQEQKLTVGDLNKADIQQQVLDGAFLPHLNQLGMNKDNLGRHKNQAGYVMPDVAELNGFAQGREMKLYNGFTKEMEKNFGFKRNELYLSMAYHDVSEYDAKARYSMREFQIMRETFGEKSLSYQKMLELTQGPVSEAHRAFGATVTNSLLDWDKLNQKDEIIQKGNVIFDMTGAVARTDGTNFIKKNGAYIVDGTSLPGIPKTKNRSFVDEKGTMADPMSIVLFDKDKGMEKTLGEMLEGTKGKAYVQTQPEEANWFSQNYIPVVGKMAENERSEFDGSHPRTIQKNFERAFENIKEMNEMETVGTLVEKDLALVQKHQGEVLTNGNKAISGYQESLSRYMTSTRQGDFNKGTLTMHSQHGSSAVMGSFNPLEQFEGSFSSENGKLKSTWSQNKARMEIGDYVVSKDSAARYIDGLEDNILSANNISLNDVAEKQGVKVRQLTTAQKQAYILDSLQYGNEGPDGKKLDVFLNYNRQPTQAQGSIQTLSLRISEEMTTAGDDRALIGVASAKLSAADYDGDHGYASLDLYSGKETKSRLRRLQAEMKNKNATFREEGAAISESIMNDLAGKAFKRERLGMLAQERSIWEKSNPDAIAGLEGKDASAWLEQLGAEERLAVETRVAQEATNRMQDGLLQHQNIVSYSFQANVEDARNMFRRRDGLADDAIAKTVSIQAGRGIGLVDNAVVGGRNLLYYAANEAMSNGVIEPEMFKKVMSSYDQQGNILVQKLISAKKVSESAIGYDASATDGANFENALDYLEETLGISGRIKNVRKEEIDDVMGILAKREIIDADDVEASGAMREALTYLSYANEATYQKGGMYNSAFSIRSDGSADNKLIRQLSENPQQVLGTENVRELTSKAFSQEQSQTIIDALDETGRDAGRRFGTLLNSGGQTASQLLDSSAKQFAEMAESSYIHRSSSKSKTANVVDMLSGVGEAFTDSMPTKMAMGFGAAWMLGSAIKSGPTPEGNEAQQEATPVEVNPAALLTSPTARVTPNRGENVRLQVSGSGNVDESTISGLINSQVAGMTGMQMNMNVNVTDNTQSLDKSFYEQAMNRVLGF